MWLSGATLLFLASSGLVSGRHTPQVVLEGHSAKNFLTTTDDLFGLHKNLTEIESISGNEEAVGQWLTASLKSQGYHTELQYLQKEPARFNILAWPGERRDARILLSSHIDTVPPFYPYKHNEKTIAGRGSVDDKGSVAAQIIAVNRLISHAKISPDYVALLFVVGEETGGDGMRAANSLDLNPQTVIFGEPTEGKLAAGHKGNLGLTITAKGKAAHSGYPWLGRSANEVLVSSLTALMALAPKLPTSDKYGITTINLGKIEGGVAANVISQDAYASVAVRIAEGSPKYIKTEIVRAVHKAVQPFLKDDMKPEDVVDIAWSNAGYGPIDIDHDVPGFDIITVNYGTDIPWFKQTVAEQKRYLYGPGSILVAHSDHEQLTDDQLLEAVDGYERIVQHALGK